MTLKIFVRLTGQDDNIGDVVLRRAIIGALRKYGELHILVGDATQGFLGGLAIRKVDTLYTDMSTWKRALWKSAVRRRTWWVDKPGEFQLTQGMYAGQRSLIPLILAIRSRGGRAVKLGVGQRASSPEFLSRYRRVFRLLTFVGWRDVESHKDFGFGEIMPDWGFAELGKGLEVAADRRDLLVLSYRSDLPVLSTSTLEGIQRFARDAGLSITVVTQVKRDESRTTELAQALGASTVSWPENRSHDAQESELREIYSRAAVVVSDRLHVLIVAATEGAVPVNLVDQPDMKVQRHFEAVHYPRLTVDARELSGAQVAEALHEQAVRGEELMARIRSADHDLGLVTARALGPLPVG